MIRFVSSLLLPVLLVLALPATAQAVWTAPVTLSATGRVAVHNDTGIDQSGNSVIVWMRRDGTTDCGGSPGCNRIQIVARSAAGTLSSVQDLSPSGLHAKLPQVDLDASGNAVAAWFGHSQFGSAAECTDCSVLTRARLADGTLSTTQTIAGAGEAYNSPFGFTFPQLAVDPGGDAVFAWEGRDTTTDCGGCSVLGRARSAAGTLSAAQIVAASPASQPDVAIEPDGDAVFVWLQFDPTTICNRGCHRVQLRTRSASGVLSAIQTLTPDGRDAQAPQVAVDASGNAIVAWRRQDGTTDCSGSDCVRIQVRVRSANGTLSQTQTLSGPGQAAGPPEIAINQAGDAAIAWVRQDGTTGCGGAGGCQRTQARVRPAGGSWSPTQTLSAPGQHAGPPQVGIDQNGNAVFAWVRSDGMPTSTCGDSNGCSRIQARVRSATGTLGATKTLSAAGVDSVLPQLAVNEAGNAALSWTRNSKPFSRIQAAFGP